MRFLVDECTGPSVAEWLRNQKHEVFSIFEEARGMVAKIESAFEAVRGSVSRVHITRWEGPETFDRLIDHSSNTGTIIEK